VEEQPLVSVIIPAKNEGRNVVNTLESIRAAACSTTYEVVVVDDGSEDGCCQPLAGEARSGALKVIRTPGLGSAKARNLGAAVARGEILVFCDAHIFVEDHWLDRLIEPLQNGTLDAVCPAIAPHDRPSHVSGGFTWDEKLAFTWLPRPAKLSPAPLLPGGCLAVKKSVFFDIEEFERGFLVWGREDEEISLKMWLFGYRLGVHPGVKILHIFRPRHPYRVTWEHVDYNLLRMAYSHFSTGRVARVLELIRHHPNSQMVARRVLESDVIDQRAKYFRRRKRDDDWFFRVFKIPF